jgi:DNA polymerase-3 subunit epsilon
VSLFRRTPEQRRERALRDAAPGPLRDYLASPLPGPEAPLDGLRLLAVDIETTGLDPRRDRVLSIGWLPVDGHRVVLGGAGRVVVRDEGGASGVGQSATVHGLTDDRLAAGVPVEDAVARLLSALAGRVLLAHFARIETAFLGAVCERAWGAVMPCVVVDTFELERRAVAGGWGSEPAGGALRLWTARERFGLPVYRAHEALTDALACAELYLAQRAELQATDPETTLTLRHVVA